MVNKYSLDKQKTVLMIIDIQDRLATAMKYKEQVIKNTNILITTAKTMGMPTIVTEQYPKGLGHTSEAIQIETGTAIFAKTMFSAYTEEIVTAIKETGGKKIIITGMEAHICVFQTVRDLLAAGYEVFVVSDAVCSRTKGNYLNALSLMSNMGAVVTNTETVLFDLLKEAGTAEFKALSPLIK